MESLLKTEDIIIPDTLDNEQFQEKKAGLTLNPQIIHDWGKKSDQLYKYVKLSALKYFVNGNFSAASYYFTIALEYCPSYHLKNEESPGI